MRLNLTGSLMAALMLSAAVSLPAPDVADAAMRGDREAVRALLQRGADANAAQGDGMTALHWAAERADSEMTAMLLTAGASVRAITRIGSYTALHLAAKSGSAPVIELLVKAGADVNVATTNSGATPIHLAAASGSVRAVELLADAGADLNAREGLWGQTPLIFAASLDRADVIRTLLAKGADPDVKTRTTSEDVRAADAASTARIREMIRLVGPNATPAQLQAAIAAGRQARTAGTSSAPAQAEGPPANRDPDEVNLGQAILPGGMTALLHAARQGHVGAIDALLDGGADIDLPTVIDRTTPVHIAVINSQWDAAMLLIERGADPNTTSSVTAASPIWSTINAQYQPRTRFPQPQEASFQRHGYLDVIEALLKAGADPDAITSTQPYYLNYAGCGNTNCGLTQLGGTTAFWRAAHGADVEAMRLLATWGADPRIARRPQPQQPGRGGGAGRGGGGGGGGGGRGGAAADSAGGRGGRAAAAEPEAPPPPPVPTAPALAIHAGAGLGFGQGVGAGNANRYVPNGWMPTLRYLVEELGFDVNARDDTGYTPLHFAAARGDHEMIMYLIEKGADIKARSRPANQYPQGYTVADMANGPQPRITPMPATIELLVKLGSEFTNKCLSC
jgi:ankyrin repeat protein